MQNNKAKENNFVCFRKKHILCKDVLKILKYKFHRYRNHDFFTFLMYILSTDISNVLPFLGGKKPIVYKYWENKIYHLILMYSWSQFYW